MADEKDDDAKKKSRKPGCFAYLILIGVAAIGGGIYLMSRWDAIPGLARAGAVVLVVIGTLALLPPLLVLAVGIVMKALLGKITKGLSGAAKEMIDANKSMYGAVHEFRPAADEDFDGLNRAYYDDTGRQLAETHGYRPLGDLVDKTIEENNDLTTPIRVLSSADGTTQVALYHFKLPHMPEKFADKEMLICDVTTEFSDGTFLMTSNTQESDLTTPPPKIEKRKHPLGTPVLDMVLAHETDKQKFLSDHPDVTAVAVHTIAEAIASEKRQQAAKNAFRKEIGYVDPDEVRRVAEGVTDDAEFPDAAAKAVDEARRKEQEP